MTSANVVRIVHISSTSQLQEIDMYQLREKVAYSKLGKFVATIVRNKFYPEARVHWVQQAFADGRFYK